MELDITSHEIGGAVLELRFLRLKKKKIMIFNL